MDKKITRKDVLNAVKKDGDILFSIDKSFWLDAEIVYQSTKEIYDNIDDRISKMSKKVEYAGMPELKCLSEMLNIVINIYVEININDNTTNKLVDYSSNEEDPNSCMCASLY